MWDKKGMRPHKHYKFQHLPHHASPHHARPHHRETGCDEVCIDELSRIFWTNPGLKYEDFPKEVRSHINALTQRVVATEDWEKYWLGSNYNKGSMGPYFAAFFQDAGQWQALFADLDLNVCGGESMQDCFANAQHSLESTLRRMLAEETPIPHASPLSDAQQKIDHLLEMMDRPRPREIFVQMVPCALAADRQISVSLSFDEKTLAQIDDMASSLGLSRSEFLAKAALAYK